VTAAVREVEEETGLRIRLQRPLSDQHYPVGDRMKTVHYWVARVAGDDDVSSYLVNEEIDELVWLPFAKAAKLLTYERDRGTLVEAEQKRRRTRPLLVLRHAKAHSRNRWRADDRFRPLIKVGARQAERLVPLLAAYDPTRLVTSSSARCVATVVPYADATGRRIRTEEGLSEEEATSVGVTALVEELVASGKRTVLCTHRPVLPAVFAALGIEDPDLDVAELVVVHLCHGEVVDLERHWVR
jgi:8-oxo-dGTP diphosphatase